MRLVHKFLIVLIILSFSSCKGSNANSPQSEFKEDTPYYYGLKACDENNEKEAIRFFHDARKKGSDLIARRSAEALTQLGNVRERHDAAIYLIERWKDDSALLVACQELLKNNEYAEIIRLTKSIDLATASNELVEIRMNSLLEKRDSQFDKEYFLWTVSRPLSPQHLEFYQLYLSKQLSKIQNLQDKVEINENLSSFEVPVSREQVVIDFRVSVYKQKYAAAFGVSDQILKYYEDEGLEVDDQVLSDIGKAALYGSDNYYLSAKDFDDLAMKLNGKKKFYAYFYAARLYDKDGRYQKQVDYRFRSALTDAPDEKNFDNALWYLLSFQLRTSVDDIIDTLKTYGSKISDPEYFDDFFDSLSVLLISNNRWQDFFRVWKETDSNFSEKTAGKYAYISGRLIEEGLAVGEAGLKTRQTIDAFTKVLSGGGDFYYKVLALERLNIVEKELIESELLSNGEAAAEEKSDAAGKLLSGYAAFGFPQKIYSEWLLNRNNIRLEDTIRVAKFLNNCEKYEDETKASYAVQSLRIATRAKNSYFGKIPKELLELCYPRFYEKEVSEFARENELPEYLLFALIRTESFFDKNISSKAGAMGLMQLMGATADEVARKLKMEEYDIFDGSTNIKLGSYYLKSLINRTDNNSILLALFAYNGGLANVRKWIRSTRNEWYKLGKGFHEPAGMSMDLFLETLPYSETRDYGRKLVEASAMYAWLYYEKTPAEIVREIMY